VNLIQTAGVYHSPNQIRDAEEEPELPARILRKDCRRKVHTGESK